MLSICCIKVSITTITQACSLAEKQPLKHEQKTATTYTACRQGLQSLQHVQLDHPHSQLDCISWLLAPNGHNGSQGKSHGWLITTG